jgi:hypothetical protein
MLSIILTASVMFPAAATEKVILAILGGGGILGVPVVLGVLLAGKKDARTAIAPVGLASRGTWRMPPLGALPPPRLSIAVKTWMFVLRAYLVLAAGLVLIRIVTLVAS